MSFIVSSANGENQKGSMDMSSLFISSANGNKAPVSSSRFDDAIAMQVPQESQNQASNSLSK